MQPKIFKFDMLRDRQPGIRGTTTVATFNVRVGDLELHDVALVRGLGGAPLIYCPLRICHGDARRPAFRFSDDLRAAIAAEAVAEFRAAGGVGFERAAA